MFYYLYEIKNTITGKIYVGVHETDNLDDGYMGSGTYLRRSISKYGIQNFQKEILQYFSSSEEMYQREREIVNEEFLKRKDVYNKNLGGNGGWHYINNNKKNVDIVAQKILHPDLNERAIKARREKGVGVDNDPALRCKGGQKARELKVGYMDPVIRQKGVESARTEYSNNKRKITMKTNKHSQGENNSQFGTCWITNGKENSKIQKTSIIPDGWWKGRKVK